MLRRLRRLKGDGGWFGVISLLIIPLAILGIPIAFACFYIAYQI